MGAESAGPSKVFGKQSAIRTGFYWVPRSEAVKVSVTPPNLLVRLDVCTLTVGLLRTAMQSNRLTVLRSGEITDCCLLGCHVASLGERLPTFRKNLLPTI